MDTRLENLSRNVFAAMKASQLSTEDLADRIGVSPSSMWRKLNGTSEYRLSEVQRIADTCGVDFDDLVRQPSSPPPPAAVPPTRLTPDLIRALRQIVRDEIAKAPRPDKVAFTIPEAAEAVGLSVSSIRAAIDRSDLVPSYPTSKPVILRDELDRWLRSAPNDRQ